MWHDPMDALIADIGAIVEATSPQAHRSAALVHGPAAPGHPDPRRADADWNVMDPDQLDPTFEEEFAECRARWPKLYKQDTPDET